MAALSILLLAAPATVSAQTPDAEEAAGSALADEATEEEDGSALSGFVQFDGNTNFMLYGLDVWSGGNFNDLVFNPSMGLEIALPAGFSINAGTWWDVNDNAASSMGGAGIQEVDVWIGLGYSWKIINASVTYQEWLYGGGSERIMDFALGLDTLLNPSMTIHTRISGVGLAAAGRGVNGGSDMAAGAVFVFGVEEGFDLGPVGLSFPVQLGLVTNGFHVTNQGGFGYINAGVQASYGLSFIPGKYGDWALSAGGTYWYTDPTNVANTDPSGTNDHIFAMNFGVGVGF